MKTFILNEQHLQEIAGRLDAIARGGISAAGCEHITGIHAVLGKIVAEANDPEADSNVVQIDQAKTRGEAQ